MGFLLLIVVYVLTYVGSKTFCLSPAMLMKLLIMMEYILHMSITTKKKLYLNYNSDTITHVIHSFIFVVIIILATIRTLESLQAWPVWLYSDYAKTAQSSCLNCIQMM